MHKLIQKIKQTPEAISFDEVMAVIDEHYNFNPSAFINGKLKNLQNENNGSCKLFSFAKLQELTELQTLACFGQYYRNDVLKNPQGNDHQNIRNFIKTGWSAIKFDQQPLTPK
jgi:HopJ type III effector protein